MWGEGTVLAGRYQLRQRIGGGSMGDVWRALDTVLGREVAVKILLPALLDDAGFAARFHTEARVLAALSHPGIVSVFDYGEADDPRTAFLVMELIAGRPLSDLLDDSAPLSEATTLTVVAQTLEALQAAHDRGIVHRDVKPANLMLREGSVVVTDFGVARTADARRLTAADVVLGTAVYAAPEQARHTAVTAAADQYAVGVIAYECLTGAPPFDGGTPLGIMMKHLQEPVPPLPDTVSAPVRDLVMRALAKDPAARFASAREMAEAARRLVAAAESVTRIGAAQDSFQTGVDVAAVEAAAAGGAAGGARADADFLSFTVVPREEEAAGDDGAEEAAPDGGGDAEVTASTGPDTAPAWASYAVRPQAEGTDWASFTVRSQGDETAPLPDGEALVEEEPEPKAEVHGGSGRMVPQDSFTAGVEIPAEADVRRPARAGFGARRRKRHGGEELAEAALSEREADAASSVKPEADAAVAPEPSLEQEAEAAVAPEPSVEQEAEAAVAPEPSLEQEAEAAVAPEPSVEQEAEMAAADPEPSRPPIRIAPGHAMPLDSFNAGFDLDLVDDDALESPDAEPEPEPSAADPGRRRAIALAAAGVVAVVAIAVAYPLSHGGSRASAAGGVPMALASATSASSAVYASAVSVTSVISETSTVVVSATPDASSKSSATAVVPPVSSVGKPVPTSSAGSVLSPRPPVSSAASSLAAVPPPVTSSTPVVPHKSGYITNVGDGDAIDVFGNSSGAPLYGDGASLTVEPQAGRAGQSFQATALTSNGQAVYEFGDGLDTNQLIDASGGKISLSHCGCGSVNQMWWLSQDSSTPSGAFYLNSQGAAGQCLTDNGQTNALTLKPCVAGNKAQQWYLP